MTALPTFGNFAGGIVVALTVAGVAPGCAEIMGKRATAGAVSELQSQASNDPDKQVSRVAGGRAAEGALAALDEPAQRARIDHLVSQTVAAAATAAVATATRQMIAELGPDGQGPLAVSLSRTGERVSAAAVGSVGREIAALAPECDGPDPLGCIERRLQRTARSTASSFTSGVEDSVEHSMGWKLLLVAFALGAGGGVLASWLWSLRHYRRRTLRMA